MRYFKIDISGYGGEFVFGNTTSEFVEYWKTRDMDDLVSHLGSLEWDESEADTDSPTTAEDANAMWHELDDLEHFNGAYVDNDYAVTEIELNDGIRYEDGIAWGDYTEISDPETYSFDNHVYSREAYINDTEESDVENAQPVIQVHTAEKGGFGEVIVCTDDKGFNPEKFAVGVVETDLGEFAETFWYDGEEVDADYSNGSTMGKGMYASVGYINPEYHEKIEDFGADSEVVKDFFQELEPS